MVQLGCQHLETRGKFNDLYLHNIQTFLLVWFYAQMQRNQATRRNISERLAIVWVPADHIYLYINEEWGENCNYLRKCAHLRKNALFLINTQQFAINRQKLPTFGTVYTPPKTHRRLDSDDVTLLNVSSLYSSTKVSFQNRCTFSTHSLPTKQQNIFK